MSDNKTPEKVRKRINWWLWKDSCPKCGAMNLTWRNKYRRKWIYRNDKWELVEQQQRICDSCHHEFWM